ncbi:MAG: hypothetical protein QXG00_08485 [Candidatus Woesearchaeota archaeon]
MKTIINILILLLAFFLFYCNEEKKEQATQKQSDTLAQKDTLHYQPTLKDKEQLMLFYNEIIRYWTSEDWMKEFVGMANSMFTEATKMMNNGENPNPKIQEMGKAFEEKIWHKYLDILYASGFKSEEEKVMIEEALSSDSTIVAMQNKVETLTKEFNEKLMKKIDPLRDAFLKKAEEMGAKKKLKQ